MTSRIAPSRVVRAALLCCVSAVVFALSAFAAEPQKKSFDVPAGPAPAALKQFISQSGVQLLYVPGEVKDVQTKAVKGSFTPAEAIDVLLADTGLVSHVADTGAISVSRAIDPNVARAIAQTEKSDRPEKSDARNETDEQGNKVLKLDTFEVFGRKTLNMDIQRSVDDSQPYVVFDRVVIEQSGVRNLQDFFRQRLTAGVIATTSAQSPTSLTGDTGGSINLRGLGSSQTLILIDGHRVPDPNYGATTSQPSITHLPIGAIERVEVLSTTSSGIYGGSATGGVINIILRRDYTGLETKLTYANTFDTDSAIRTVDLSGGFTLEDGRTSVLMAASWTDANHLFSQDRDFTTRAIAAIRANNPGSTTLIGANPPLGATTNVRSANGTNLVLKSGAALNSPTTFVPDGYAGPQSDGGAALVANAGKYNYQQAGDGNYATNPFAGGRASLVNAPERHALMATVRRQFSKSFEAFVEGYASNSRGHSNLNIIANSYTLPVSAPNNPFTQAIRVTVPNLVREFDNDPVTKTRRVVAGIITQLPRDWKVEADYTWQEDILHNDGTEALLATGTALINNGTLNVMRDLRVAPLDLTPYLSTNGYYEGTSSVLNDVAIRAAGKTFQLPAGPVNLAFMGELRRVNMGEATSVNEAVNSYFFYPARLQTVESMYGEVNAPLLRASSGDARPLLSLQLAGRFDRYDSQAYSLPAMVPIGTPVPPVTLGRNRVSSFDPTLALRFQPSPDAAFRVSFGTGFQPPGLSQLALSVSTSTAGSITDPRRGNSLTTSDVTIYNGGNPSLRPEKSESWSAGVILTPRIAPGLRLSVDYTRIRKEDNIAGATASSFPLLLAAEDLNPGRVIRGPNLPGDPAGWAGPITALDFSLLNQASAYLEAVDMQFDYDYRASIGRVTLSGMATWTPHFRTRLTASSEEIENAGIGRANPLKLRANLGVTFRRERWSCGWFATYFDSYLASATPSVLLDQGGDGRVASQVYHHVNVSYRFGQTGGRGGRLLGGVELQAGVKNIFNKAPPFDVVATRLYYSTLADPLLASYYVSVKKAF